MFGQNLPSRTSLRSKAHRPLAKALAVAGLVASISAVSTGAWALGLGRLNVTSALGQPLMGNIELFLDAGETLDTVRARVASPELYKSQNLDYSASLTRVRVTPQTVNGRPVLTLSSTGPVQEPYLDLLVEVNAPTGRIVREYVFLLDPAGVATAQSVEPNLPPRPIALPTPSAPAPVMVAPPAPAPMPVPPPMVMESSPAPVAAAPRSVPAPRPVVKAAPAPRVAKPAPAPAAVADRSGGKKVVVRPGDTLSNIADRNFIPGVSLEQMLIAMQRANPDAFVNGNINVLRAGATVTVPGSAEAKNVSPAEALNEVRAQTESWRGYQARVADRVPLVGGGKSSGAVSGKITTATPNDVEAKAKADRLQVSQASKASAAKDDAAAKKKAVDEAESRKKDLEKSVADLKSALALKNAPLAEKQKQAEEAKSPTKAADVKVAAAPTPTAATVATVAPSAPAGAPAKAAAPAPAPTAAPTPAPTAAPTPAPTAAPTPAPTATPTPAPTAAPTPAPTSAPKVATAVPTPVAADSGIMGMLGDLWPALAGVAALGGGALWWARRRKKSAADDTEPTLARSAIVDTQAAPDTVFGEASTAGGNVNTKSGLLQPSQFSRSGFGNIDAGEVDPVAEADVYIAYGRETQAEEILLEALKNDPNRVEVRQKLLEVYGLLGRRSDFDDHLEKLHDAQAGNPEGWASTAAVAKRFYPDHSRVAGAPVPPIEPGSGLGVVAATGAAGAAMAAAVAARASSPAPAPAVAMPAPPSAAIIYDEPKRVEPDVNVGALDFTLDDGLKVPTLRRPTMMGEFLTPTQPPMMAAPTFTPPTPPRAAKPAAMEFGLEQDLADLEAGLARAMDKQGGPAAFARMDRDSVMTGSKLSPALRAASLDLGIDPDLAFTAPQSSKLEVRFEDAATKIDLAKAYEEMGDKDGAREILLEVMREGNEQQKKDAQSIIDRLK